MDIIADNLAWMWLNVFLALIPMFSGFFIFKTKKKFLKIIFFIIWLLFIPNTLYVFTDLIYIPEQWSKIGDIEKIYLILQYSALEIIGLVSFVYSVYVFKKLFKKYKKNTISISLAIFLLNFLIGFGIVLGRTQRTNSWDIVMNPGKVLIDSVRIISSQNLLIMVILFGVFGNTVYFFLKDKLIKKMKAYGLK